MTAASTPPLLEGKDGRRLADFARPASRRLRWRISTATADHLAAQRAVDHVRTTLQAHAGPLLVGQIHLCAAGPAQAPGRLQLLRNGLEQGVIVSYPTETLDAIATSLASDHRRWLIFAAARVLTPQCSHTVVYS